VLGRRLREDRRAQALVHVRLAGGDHVNGLAQLAEAAGLQREAESSGLECLGEQRVLLRAGVEQDAEIRQAFEQSPRECGAGLIGQLDVQDRYVGRLRDDRRVAFGRGPLAGRHDASVTAEHRLDARPDSLVVLDEGDSDRAAVSFRHRVP
jgi:hypothetical protein